MGAVGSPGTVPLLALVGLRWLLAQLLQVELARLIRAGQPRQAWASVMTAMLPAPLRGPVRPLSWSAVGSMAPGDPMDVLVTVGSEDAFDVEADLPRITAPTLVIGGAKDPF